jgi:hypothetical protein
MNGSDVERAHEIGHEMSHNRRHIDRENRADEERDVDAFVECHLASAKQHDQGERHKVGNDDREADDHPQDIQSHGFVLSGR